MATVVISPVRVADSPDVGGHFWVYAQYASGLRRLGCEVYWLEAFHGTGDAVADASALAAFRGRMARFGLGECLLLYDGRDRGAPGEAPIVFLGASQARAEAIFRRADLLLNFDYSIHPRLLAQFRRTALVDIDPGLLQFWISVGQISAPDHDLYLTIGETVGTPAARFPDCGRPWVHIRPPICLELWPYRFDPRCEAFTTVSSWWGDEEFIVDGKGVCYENNKRVTFLEFAELPHRTGQRLELALFLSAEATDLRDRHFMEERGWHIRHSLEVARTPEMYRSFIQGSRGEFSCCKPSCIEFQNAWISDRTLCYLASGKPAVVQDTGPSSFLPNGEGIFRFTTLAEAADALAVVNADYERHCRAARELAEAYFDSDKVLSHLLDAALGSSRHGTAGGHDMMTPQLLP